MLRKRKNRRYNEETNDEDGERKFDLAEQIKSERFNQIREKHLQELAGEALTLRLIQKHGFEKPILVIKPEGLDLRVPPKTFLVRDVRNSVGHDRIIDVMDVKTQKNIEMSMKDWCKYYESKSRDRLLNVISLEFSHTKLDTLVESPMIVKALDWVDLVWPKFLKESQTESTNTINKMKYPKVQKYCLMSVKGSYTDFHIDFGGTSVWYHILKGRKIFWMVPPTELNLQIFEEWTLSGMQQDVFFGDTVEECFRVELRAGNTFFIPSGWIHAVYTLEDSLVFGGNFLHSFGIENQLKVSKIEDATKVPIKFRYPFYTEILWYVVQHYVYCLSHKDHLHRPDKVATPIPTSLALEKPTNERKNKKSIEIEDEDETTESEQEESDMNNKRKVPASKRNKRPKQTTPRSSTKKVKKPPTDDEETDIDSGNEELNKPSAGKVSANTCRMTKNSLLRLQYEVEEQQQSPNKTTNKSISKSDSPTKSNSNKIEPESNQQQSPNAQATLNLAEIVLSHESKLNGWSSSWSNPNTGTKEPDKIHITKFELNGLKVLVKHLSKLSGAKKNLPNLIRNSRALLDDCRKLIVEHENDNPELAITGKPITPEMLLHKKTDMNELIGQFFKPIGATGNEEPFISNSLSHLAMITKSKSESISPLSSTSLTNQQRLKLNQSDSDEKKTNTTSTSNSNDNVSKSPQKETKCLSPNKKLSNSTSLSSSTLASPPPRPKSPPTRPLSNNQYKTKKNNDLLLPGSFADLIAATSTKKEAFDLSGAEVFNATSSSASPSSSTVKLASKQERDKLNSKRQHQQMSTTVKQQSTLQDSLLPVSSSFSANSAPIASVKEQPKLSSPEPAKVALQQKRFITPASFRPQLNKEKLIYASAPYISPVHASDPSRMANPYPWQTPTHHPQQQHLQQQQQHHHQQQQQHPPTYYPTTPRSTHSTPSAIPSSSIGQTATYSPDCRLPTTNQTNHALPLPIAQNTAQNKNQVPAHSVAARASIDSANNPNHHHQQQQEKHVNNDREHHSQADDAIKVQQPQRRTSDVQESATSCSSSPLVNVAKVDNLTKTDHTETPATADTQSKAKKPAKPRGPPKKSKEARLAIECTESETIKPVSLSIPTSVIKLAQSATQPSESIAQMSASALNTKTKSKRPSKKQKDSNQALHTAISPTQFAQATTSQPPNQQQPCQATQVKPQAQPSVICGLVTPSTSAAGAPKMNQSYLISRPLMFNNMPTFSAAQFHHMPRAPVPILTTAPMGAPMRLPLQQGARIVWATQPRRLQAPAVNSAPVPLPMMAAPTATRIIAPRVPVPSSHDNAALLSLATTALSTAPMISSPALGHMSNRASKPGAVMMNSHVNPQPFFANQQFFRPFMQRMPMTQFVNQPGGSRPTGQLVFARLPNQNQPRYLITQPGFLQQRMMAPHIVTSQPTPTLAFAAFKPPDSTKAMKTKKVKTS